MARQEIIAKPFYKKVIGTAHSYRRLKQRGFTGDQLTGFCTDMVSKCLADKRFRNAPDNTEWFIYSRRLRTGLMVAYRRDFKSEDIDRSFIIMTVYPHGSSRPLQQGTPTITV